MKEKGEEIIEQAFKVFMKYGIKAVTMDDMARHLGISKKTLYKYVKDKNDLVEQSLDFQCAYEHEAVCTIREQGLNAIDEMYEIGHFVSSLLKEVHPSIHYDLEKYHPGALKNKLNKHFENMHKCMLENLNKGIKDGMYRKDLNAEVIAKIYFKKIDILFDTQMFPPDQITTQELYAVLFRYHIRGIASKKGIEYLEQKEKKQRKVRA